MTIYETGDVRSAIEATLREHGLSWEEFVELGEADELIDISSDLDYAFRHLVPLVAGRQTAAV